MSDNTEALRLADEVLRVAKWTDSEHWDTLDQAAAELRRLYRENQFLKHDLYDCAKACEQIAAAEREQCAKEAELCIKTEPKVSIRAANAIAAAIRSRT